MNKLELEIDYLYICTEKATKDALPNWDQSGIMELDFGNIAWIVNRAMEIYEGE